MELIRQLISRKARNDPPKVSPDESSLPEKRYFHECALVDDHLHLFGGGHGSKHFPRNEIWVTNVRRAKKWIRRLTRSRTIPPPCKGARCVVIDKMIYSYGGLTDDGRRLGIVYRLDPKKMEWIEVATPIGGKKPPGRSHCCLCAIGSRVIMFGGRSGDEIPRGEEEEEEVQEEDDDYEEEDEDEEEEAITNTDISLSEGEENDQLQFGATQDEDGWSNDIYEFEFEEENDGVYGVWLDLELSGTRPKPLVNAAMANIDRHRALLHGIDMNGKTQSFGINLNHKTWTIIDFNVEPSSRLDHGICQLVKEGLEDKSICLLIGGEILNKTNSDHIYVLDYENSKAYKMDVNSQLGEIAGHTCHCVQNEDKTAEVFVCGGTDDDWTLKPILSSFHLDFNNESYMRIEQEILLSRIPPVCAAIPSPHFSLPSGSEDMEMLQRELEHLRRRCAKLVEEKRANTTRFEEQTRQAQGRFDEEKASIRSLMTLHLCQPIRESFCNFREELASSQQEVQRKDGSFSCF
ncbi:uncharacterized protein [Oscarella lobularis]|uniref:uncharacterized protein isoform X2 n=1 Tax=Oscarella lobularis TaxID=121494 RepID=UPI0033135608